MPKINTVLTKVFLILFGIGLALLLVELGLRVLGKDDGRTFGSFDEVRKTIISEPRDSSDAPSDPMVRSANLRAIINPHPDNRIIFELAPNLNLTFQKVPVRTNSCGMRGPEVERPKPANRFRIAILGDSFTFGWGVKEEESFASRLQAELNERSGSKVQFEVLNFGTPGYSTFQEVYSFLEKGLEFQPDYVLVFFIQNDFGLPFFVRNVEKGSGFLAATKLGSLINQAIDPRWEEHASEIAGYDPNRSLSALSDALREKGIPLGITFNTRKDWTEDRRRLWVLRKRREIQLLDMYEDFERFIQARGIEKTSLVLPDDPHPSPLRHRIWGAQLASYFLQYSSSLNP